MCEYGDVWENHFEDEIIEVLAPVPSYEEWQELKLHDEKATIKLGEKIIENDKLKELLRECKEFFEEENPKDFTVMSERMDELLTKIDNAIGEKK